MQPIPFGPFQPSRSRYALLASTTAINVIPVKDGWGPMPSLVAITEALASTPKGSILVRTSAGAFAIYAGTTTKLYKMDTSSTPYTWTEVGTGYNVPVGDRWSFDVFGTNLVATNLTDGLQWIDVDSGSAFATESAAPNAKYAWVAGEHLVLGHTSDSPNEIRWSAIRDMTNWTEGSRGSSSQIFQSGNEVQGGIGSQNGAIVFQRDMIRTQIRNGDINSAFNMDILNPAIGAISPLSIVNISTNNFAWLSEKGFYMGPNAEPIGEIEDIDDWFLSGDELDLTYIAEVVGMNDPFRDIVWWQYQKTDATKALLGYNYFHRRWCYSNLNVSDLSAMATAAVTIDGLDALYATIDDVDVAFDARLLQGGRPTLNGWDTDDKLGIFSGPNLEATVTTADVQFGPGHTTPHEMRVVTDATGVTVKQTTSKFHGGTRTQGSAVSMHSRTGMVNFRVSALLHGFEATIPAGTDWNVITAMAPVRVSKDGDI